MSIICGINLSDRLYIGGDSRLSRTVNGTVEVINDETLKVEHIKKSQGCLIASAGNAKFAQHVLTKLYDSNIASQGIAYIRKGVEEWVKDVASEYFIANHSCSAAFIIGGADKGSKKIIEGQAVVDLTTEHTGGTGSGSMKKVLADAITSKTDNLSTITLEANNTMLFAVEVTPAGVQIKDSCWGEYLIYGPKGIEKGSITPKNIASFEFQGRDSKGDLIVFAGMLHALTEKKEMNTVGGCMTVFGLVEDGTTLFMEGDIKRMNFFGLPPESINRVRLAGNTFYRIDENGAYRKMIKVSECEDIETTGGFFF